MHCFNFRFNLWGKKAGGDKNGLLGLRLGHRYVFFIFFLLLINVLPQFLGPTYDVTMEKDLPIRHLGQELLAWTASQVLLNRQTVLPAERLFNILLNILESILDNNYVFVRGNLYAVLINFIHLMRSSHDNKASQQGDANMFATMSISHSTMGDNLAFSGSESLLPILKPGESWNYTTRLMFEFWHKNPAWYTSSMVKLEPWRKSLINPLKV